MTPRRILRIARWEIASTVGTIDRRSAVALLVVVSALAVAVPVVADANPAPAGGIYRVGVASDNPYHDAIANDRRLRPVAVGRDPSIADFDVLVTGDEVVVANTDRGHAAASAFREAIVAYNDRQMRAEANQTAAFPVTVTIQYRSQDGTGVAIDDVSGGTGGGQVPRSNKQSATTGAPGTETYPGGGSAPTASGDSGATASASTTAGAEQSTGDAGTGGSTSGSSAETTTEAAGLDAAGGGTGPLAGLFGGTQSGTPSSISPPFPLTSLLLAFVFLLPFNLVIQAYGGSVFEERLNRRGEPLLVSPASRGDIVLGKTLPYFLASVGVTAIIAGAVGGGVRSVAAITPLAGLFLAATFVAGMLVRSYKELTFVTVTISVTLTAYAFVPAVFTTVHPIAAISPLSVVVDDLQGAPVSLGAFVLSTGPVALAAGVLFVLGTGLYREEHLFSRRPLPAKVVDAVADPLRNWWDAGLWTALYIPFVFVAELFAVAVLFVLPTATSIPLVFAVVAIVEEVAKSGHVAAAFERGRFERSVRSGVALGVASGVGFFVAEKAMAVTQLVGLPGLDVGRAAFGPVLASVNVGILLVAPLVLHVVTATISALGASRSRRAYVGALFLAVLVHLGYDLAVVTQIA